MSAEPRAPRLARSVIANYLGQAAGVALAFFLNPFVIRSLGDARYGAWAVVAELVVYATLLDFGAKSALTHFVARYYGAGDPRRAVRVFVTAFWILLPIGLLVCALGVVAAGPASRALSRGQVDVGQMTAAMAIMACLIGLNIPMGAVTAGLIGRHRFDLFNGIDAGAKTLNAGLVFALLSRGGGLVSLALAHVASTVASWAAMLAALRREMPGLTLRWSAFRREEIEHLRGVGGHSFGVHLARFLIDKVDVILVGSLLGPVPAAFYQLGRILPTQLSFATENISRAFSPTLTETYSAGRLEETNRLFFTSSRAASMFSMTMISAVVCFGRPFLHNWVGPDYVTGDWTMRSDLVLIILALAQAPRMALVSSHTLIYASGDLRRLMWIYVGEAALKLVLSLSLAPHFGLVGIAAGTLAAVLLVQVGLIPGYVARRFDVPVRAWLMQCIAPAAAGAAVVAAASLGAIAWREPLDWVTFFAETAAVGALTLGVWYRFGLTGDQRARLANALRR